MSLDNKYNLRQLTVWIVFALVSAIVGIAMNAAIDANRIALFLYEFAAYVAFVVSTVHFSKLVNFLREFEREHQDKK